jgi:hypothetical protein
VRLPRAMTAATLAVAATLLTVACTPDAKVDEPAATGKAAAGKAAAGQPDEPAPVIATSEAQLSSAGKVVPVKIELSAPRREQGFVTVKVRMTNALAEGQGSSLGWQIANTFAGETRGPHGSDIFSGIYLLDRKNQKQYLVARNANEEFLASNSLNGVFVKPQQKVELFATFGAPPADVQAVDVFIPRIPVFENVPLG